MNAERRQAIRNIVLGAVWLGLATGLMEGIGSTLLRVSGGLTWQMQLEASTARVIWFAPLLYAIALLVLCGFFILVSYFLSPHAVLRAGLFSFVLLFMIDLLSLPGRLSGIAILVLALGLTLTSLRWFAKHSEVTFSFMRKTVLWIVAVTLLALAGVEGGGLLRERWAVSALPNAAPGTPNVLLIVLDALRADHISAHGYGRKTSPTLDELAGDGVLFERAISASAWTLPSHASILTGRYPHEHGADYRTRKYDGRFPTLAEVLRDRGYRTGGFSGNTMLFTRTQRFERGFVRFEDSFCTPGDMVVRTFTAGDSGGMCSVRWDGKTFRVARTRT